MQAMANLLAWKLPLHGVPVTGTVTLTSGGGSLNRYPAGQRVTFQRISGHRDGGLTECPGAALYAQLPRLRQLTAARAPSIVPAAPDPVTIGAVSDSLTYPQPAQLSGVLRGEGRISVQVKGRTRWVTVARTEVAPDGVWSASVPFTGGHLTRALQVLPNGHGGATSNPIQLTVTPSLTASAPRRVLAGSSVELTGTIGPHRRLLTLEISRRATGGRLARVAHVSVHTRFGRFKRHVRLSRPGLYRLRLRYGGDSRTQAATAPDVYVRAVRHAVDVTGGAAAPAG